jgi:hypothetical protein
MAELTADRGIKHQFATVNAHGQIGRVERRFRYYQECGLAMLRHANAPFSLLFKAIKMLNFIENNVIRDGTSRSYNLFGTWTTVKLYPFGIKVLAYGPRQKQAGFGHDKQYAFVGYSTNHKNGYELYDLVTKRIVVRGDVSCLTFYTNTSVFAKPQPTPDNQNNDGQVLSIDSGSTGERVSVKHKHRAVASPSLSLSLSLPYTFNTTL